MNESSFDCERAAFDFEYPLLASPGREAEIVEIGPPGGAAIDRAGDRARERHPVGLVG